MKLLLPLLVLASLTFADKPVGKPPITPGDAGGPGGGPVEGYFAMAYGRMDEFILETQAVDREKYSPEEMQALTSILNNLSQEKRKGTVIDFELPASEFLRWKNPCYENKIAFTPDYLAGSPIHINKSLLYDAKGKAKVEFAFAVQVMFHELGHHRGYQDHVWLDAIGAKVAARAVKMLAKESKNIDEYLKKKNTQLPRPEDFIELENFVNSDYLVPRTKKSGVFYPLSIGERGQGYLYFLPSGEPKGFEVHVAKNAALTALNKEVNESSGGLPFRGSVEELARGAAVIENGKRKLVPSDSPEVMAISNLWTSPDRDENMEEAIMGPMLLTSRAEVYLDLRNSPDRHRVGAERVYLEFIDERIKARVTAYLKKYPAPAKTYAFPIDPVQTSNGRTSARVATVAFWNK